MGVGSSLRRAALFAPPGRLTLRKGPVMVRGSAQFKSRQEQGFPELVERLILA